MTDEEKAQRKQERSKMITMFTLNAMNNHLRKKQAEEYERAEMRRQYARTEAMMSDIHANHAEREGRYAEAEKYRRDADMWRYMS